MESKKFSSLEGSKPQGDDFASVQRSVEKLGIHSRPVRYVIIEVAIDPSSKVLLAYCKALWEWTNTRSRRELRFTEDELTQYVQALITARVDYVSMKGHRPVIHYADKHAVPAFVSVVMAQIGRVRAPQLGLELAPVVLDDKAVRPSPESMTMMSLKLKALADEGFEYADGYDKDKSGSFDFMAFSLLDEKSAEMVTSYPDSAPVYALLSSFVANQRLSQLWGPLMSYGDLNEFAQWVTIFAAPRNAW